MLSMAVIFVVLGLTATLVWDYSRSLRQGAGRDTLLEAVELGAERIRSELCSAVEVTVPAAAGVSDTLVFSRIDPSSATRLPSPPPATPPSSWDPYNPTDMLLVTYSISSQELLRTVNGPTATTQERICDNLQGLTAEFVDDRTVRVVLNVQVKGYFSKVATEVPLWVER